MIIPGLRTSLLVMRLLSATLTPVSTGNDTPASTGDEPVLELVQAHDNATDGVFNSGTIPTLSLLG